MRLQKLLTTMCICTVGFVIPDKRSIVFGIVDKLSVLIRIRLTWRDLNDNKNDNVSLKPVCSTFRGQRLMPPMVECE
jgi:hypothetical protein